MKYRKLTDSGDYAFGQGLSNFWIDVPQAVGQAAQTRMQLWQETFWRDLNEGLPMMQEILGQPATPDNIDNVNNIIEARLRGTTGLTFITELNTLYDRETRAYGFDATIQTLYSETEITGAIV